MLSCTHFSLKAVYVKWTTPQKTILPCGNAKVQHLKAYDLIWSQKLKRVILPHKASCHVKKLNLHVENSHISGEQTSVIFLKNSKNFCQQGDKFIILPAYEEVEVYGEVS